MTKSAQTVFFFALYLFGLGIILIVWPNWLLGLFDIPPTTEVWIRVIGMLTILLGCYYVSAARANWLPIIELSVKARASVPVFFAVFVVLGWAPAALLLFGGVDLAGAIWTWLTLRSELGTGAKAPAA